MGEWVAGGRGRETPLGRSARLPRKQESLSPPLLYAGGLSVCVSVERYSSAH